MEIKEITVEELHGMLSSGQDFVLLDIREDYERALCRIEPSLHIPMFDLLTSRSAELDRSRPVVVYCHHGVRSLNLARHFAKLGWTNLVNLRDGIDAWSRRVDPSVRAY